MTKRTEKIQTTLRIIPDLYERVKTIAEQEGKSINDAILAFIETGVDCYGVTSPFEDQINASKLLIESLSKEQYEFLFQLAKEDMRPLSYQMAALVKEALEARMPSKKDNPK